MPKYETLKELGHLHKSKSRIIVATLVKRTDDEGKDYVYFNFHEHWPKEQDGKIILLPKKKYPTAQPQKNDRFNKNDEVISFTIPYNENTMADLNTLLQNIAQISGESKSDPF